jgi:hypothetical protein
VSTNETYLGVAAPILTTEFTSELDLLKDGNEFMLVTVVTFSWPTGWGTFYVKVEIATMALVGEASVAKPKAGITSPVLFFWRDENKVVVWMYRVLYLKG